MLIIGTAFVVSFGLAVLVTALLRGSPDPATAASATVKIGPESKLPAVRKWRVTVAVAAGGRSTPTFLRTGVAEPATAAASAQARDGLSAALRSLAAALRDTKGDRTAGTSAIAAFLDSVTGDDGTAVRRDDTVVATESARHLAAAIGGCVPKAKITAILGLIPKDDRIGLGQSGQPHLTRDRLAGDDTVVSQVGVQGGGNSRLAVAIVARLESREQKAVAAGDVVLNEIAEWVDDNVHVDDYEPVC